MNQPTARVLAKLIGRKKQGVTFSDFAVGFRLGARIWDLRAMGYEIVTLREMMDNGATRARYVLKRMRPVAKAA